MESRQIKQLVVGAITAVGIFVVAFAILNAPEGDRASEFVTVDEEGTPIPQTPIPEIGSQVPEGVAAPNLVSSASPGSEASFRRYSITVAHDEFSPHTIMVRTGDLVRMDFFAEDKTYDFYEPRYGLRQTFPRGKTFSVQFQASVAGTFPFHCPRCGGPEKGPKGELIVVPR